MRITLSDVLDREGAVVTDELRNAGSHSVGSGGSNPPGRAYFYQPEVEVTDSPQTILRRTSCKGLRP